jgi:uncharacterized repeat protein (TIGR01451 family)
MKIRNLFTKFNKVPKKYLVAAAIGLAILVPVAVKAGYGPNRPVFDWNNPAQRVGSLNGPVFNSFINTPTYGDERAFVDAKDSANTNTGGFADVVTVEPGKDYTIRQYIHNNANQDTNADGKGVAKDVNVRFKVLPGQANGNEVTGYISASNVAAGYPGTVYDTTKLKNDNQAFELEYVPGSARIENNAHPFPGVALPDSITTDAGAKVGYDQMNGDFPGCFQYTAIVTIKVHVKAPALKLTKQVTTPGSTEWHKNISVKAGDTVSWLLNYKNTGTGVDNDITIRDSLPKGLTLVPGSITWFDVNHPNGEKLQDTALTSGGVDVGNYSAGADGAIRFRTTVDKDVVDKKLCQIDNRAFAHATNVPETTDNAGVTVEGCKPPTPTPPTYSCDLLKAQLVSGTNYKFTASATATNGATIKQYTYNFGDGTQAVLTDKNVVEHNYAKPGSYVATVEVTVMVDGKPQVAKSAACMTPITIGTTPTPPTPTALPNTGAGDIAAIFAATTVAGIAAYQVFVTRRIER